MLREIDRAARKEKTDRSKFIRAAVEKVLREKRIAEMEERDIRAYQRLPQTPEEYEPWQKVQAWPEE
jgi:metal-responsive CopG/Arc/MetJ family transcriptional regulator